MRKVWNGMKLVGRWSGPALLGLGVYLYFVPPSPFLDLAAPVALVGAIFAAVAAVMATRSGHRRQRNGLAVAAVLGATYYGWSTWDAMSGFHTEEVSFSNQGARLAGTLYLPDRPGKVPGIVLVHGSGAGPRSSNSTVAWHLAKAGYAVLSYDKRGVGDSTGRYGGGTDREICPENFNLLASDASAGMKLLAGRAEVRADAVGLFGMSQAGWVIPRAAVLNGNAAFVVLLSGPTTSAQSIVRLEKLRLGIGHAPDGSLSDTLVVQGRGGRDVPKGFTSDQAYALAQTKAIPFPCADFDPTFDLGKLDAPGLWVLGGDDWIVPVGVTTANLDKLRTQGKQYDYRVIPGVTHTLTGAPKNMIWGIVDTWLARATAASSRDDQPADDALLKHASNKAEQVPDRL